MTDITSISSAGNAAFNTTPRTPEASPARPASAAAREDSADISRGAQLLSRLSELPDVRQDLIDRVRGEIAAGGYDSEDKVDALLDELVDDLA